MRHSLVFILGCSHYFQQLPDQTNWNENSNTFDTSDPVGDGDSTTEASSKQEKPQSDSTKSEAEGVSLNESEGACACAPMDLGVVILSLA